jgi:hypothetical protein
MLCDAHTDFRCLGCCHPLCRDHRVCAVCEIDDDDERSFFRLLIVREVLDTRFLNPTMLRQLTGDGGVSLNFLDLMCFHPQADGWKATDRFLSAMIKVLLRMVR